MQTRDREVLTARIYIVNRRSVILLQVPILISAVIHYVIYTRRDGPLSDSRYILKRMHYQKMKEKRHSLICQGNVESKVESSLKTSFYTRDKISLVKYMFQLLFLYNLFMYTKTFCRQYVL